MKRRALGLRRAGQLQSMETIIIVIILVVLLLIGALFYAKISSGMVRDEVRQTQQSHLATLAQTLNYLPEFSCVNFGADMKTPCLDLLKVQIMGSWLNNASDNHYDEDLRLEYYPVFGDSLVIVKRLYPEDPEDPGGIAGDEWLLYNASTGGDVFTTLIPISLDDPINNKKMLGILYIETET